MALRFQFAGRLARLREALCAQSLDALVVTSLPNIRYLTGFTGTAGAAMIAPEQGWLVVDFRYAIAANAAVSATTGLADVLSVAVAPDSIDETVAQILQAVEPARTGIEAAAMSVARFNKLSSALAGRAPSPLAVLAAPPVLVPTERLVERGRAVKDADEIALFREAGRRLALMAAEVTALPLEGRSERDVADDIGGCLRRAGFERPAFETIVASGPNGARPHATPTERVIRPHDAVVLDFGGVYDGYCVDLTRTVQLGGGPAELRRMFAAVTDAQQAALDAIRPGVTGADVDAAARGVLARHGLGEAFGHSTGHGLGLEVHEEPRIGRYIAGQPQIVLEAGMVFTVEPGAYVEGLGGVRIEDDVLVTADGCEVLTRTRPTGG